MKLLIPVSLLILGLAIGYTVGVNVDENKKNSLIITDSIPIKYKVIHDTIIKEQIIEIKSKFKKIINADSLVVDTLKIDTMFLDTLKEKLIEKPKDSIQQDNLSIVSDKRLKVIDLPISYVNENSNLADSLLQSSIDIKIVNKTLINVEFWESPIGFKGYKLSKSKLILYGLSPQLDYTILKQNDIYYLKFHSITYELKETEKFINFQ